MTLSFVRAACAAVLAFACAGGALGQADTVGYQGRLSLSGQPYTGTADYLVKIFASADASTSFGQQSFPSVTVDDGLFALDINFSPSAYSEDRWIEISVRTPAWDGQGDAPGFTRLDGRQRLGVAARSLQTRGIFVNHAGAQVGIGTDDPRAPFHIAPIGGMLIGTNPLSAGATSLSVNLSSPTDGHATMQAIRANGTLWGDIALNPSGGNVGVGTSNPQSKLHVIGEVTVSEGVRFPSMRKISNVVSATALLDFGPLPASGFVGIQAPVPGVVPGDAVIVSFDGFSQQLIYRGTIVPHAGAVRLEFQVVQAGDPPGFNAYITVLKH